MSEQQQPTVIRRYVEYVAEPVGDFEDAGPGFYVMEDQQAGAWHNIGVLINGPFETEEEAAGACEREGAGRDDASEEYLQGLRAADCSNCGWSGRASDLVMKDPTEVFDPEPRPLSPTCPECGSWNDLITIHGASHA